MGEVSPPQATPSESKRAVLSDRPISVVVSHPGLISFPRLGIFPDFLVSTVPSSVASAAPITSPTTMAPTYLAAF